MAQKMSFLGAHAGFGNQVNCRSPLKNSRKVLIALVMSGESFKHVKAFKKAMFKKDYCDA